MKLNRPLIVAAYAVAALMIVVPIVEVVLSVWPLRFGQTSWRFGTVGLLSQAALTPVLGAVVLFAAALALEHRRTLTVASILAIIVGIIMLALVPLFALDAIQMRAQVQSTAHRAFDLSSLLATIKLTCIFLIFLLLGIGGWKVRRQMSRRSRSAVPDAPLLAHK